MTVCLAVRTINLRLILTRLKTLLHFLNVCAPPCDGMKSSLLGFSSDFRCILWNTNMQGFWPMTNKIQSP